MASVSGTDPELQELLDDLLEDVDGSNAPTDLDSHTPSNNPPGDSTHLLDLNFPSIDLGDLLDGQSLELLDDMVKEMDNWQEVELVDTLTASSSVSSEVGGGSQKSAPNSISSGQGSSTPASQESLLTSPSPLSASEDSSLSPSSALACGVCSKPAGKHSYFGARVCLSCRAFFRRTVEKRGSDKLVCQEEAEKCRRFGASDCCRKCRFQKCLDVGMVASMVGLKRDKDMATRKQERKKTPNHHQHKTIVVKTPVVRRPTNFSLEETVFIKGLAQRQFDVGAKSSMEFFNLYPKEMTAAVDYFFGKSESCPSEYLIMAEPHSIDQNVRFFKQLEDFAAFQGDDAVRLIATNFPLCYELWLALGVNREIHFKPLWQKSMLALQRVSSVETQLEWVTQHFHNINLDKSTLKVCYDKVFNRFGLETFEEVLRYQALSAVAAEWYKDVATIDDDLLMISYLFVLFSPDGVEGLRDPDRAHRMQTKYSLMLHRYLKSRYAPEAARRKYLQSVYLASWARELLQLRRKSQAEAIGKAKRLLAA